VNETKHLTECVAEDPDLIPEEKETNITFDKRDDRARVFTAEAGLMRRLLSHPEFELSHVVPANGTRTEDTEELHAADTQIVGVAGTVPVGCIKLRASARNSSGHANVISH